MVELAGPADDLISFALRIGLKNGHLGVGGVGQLREAGACHEAVFDGVLLEETVHGAGRTGEQEVVINGHFRGERVVAHVGLPIFGVVEPQSIDIGFLAPGACSLGLEQGVHLLADADEVLSLGIGEQLQELGNGDVHAVVSRTRMRVLGLHFGVLGSAQLLLVVLLFLPLDSVLLVDGSEQ